MALSMTSVIFGGCHLRWLSMQRRWRESASVAGSTMRKKAGAPECPATPDLFRGARRDLMVACFEFLQAPLCLTFILSGRRLIEVLLGEIL